MANDENKNLEKDEKQFSRRDFLKTTGVATGGILAGGLLGGVITHFNESDSSTPTSSKEGASDSNDSDKSSEEQNGRSFDARVFFSNQEDFDTLAAAAERIYPEDDAGPGAIALGVPYFIDKQCHSWWGFNGKNYSDGPFEWEKTPEFGMQEKLNRGEIFKLGLAKMRTMAKDQFDENFWDLDGGDQDDILKQFEANEDAAKMDGVRADVFFNLLRDTTIWGVYADPVYGGNRNMDGWRMIDFPGPRMGWANVIEEEDFHVEEPQGLRTYQGGTM